MIKRNRSWFFAVLALFPACGPAPARQAATPVNLRKDNDLAKTNDANQLVAFAQAAAAAGDMTRATEYLVAALRQGGDEKAIVQRLIVVCVADQRYPGALDYAETYLRRHPGDTDVRLVTASIYAAIGDVAKARDGFERVIAEKPDIADAHYGLATVLTEDGSQLLNADRHYREYLRLQPRGTYAEAARDHLLKSVP
jgi:tetratricopeptide (TPR) repeat protein